MKTRKMKVGSSDKKEERTSCGEEVEKGESKSQLGGQKKSEEGQKEGRVSSWKGQIRRK